MDSKNIIEEKKSKFSIIFSAITMAFAITAIVFISYAVILTYTSVSEKNLSLVVTVTSIISIAVAGFDAAKSCKSKGWLWGILAGIIYAIILFIISVIASQRIIFSTQSLMLFLLAAASGGLGGIIGINLKNNTSSLNKTERKKK